MKERRGEKSLIRKDKREHKNSSTFGHHTQSILLKTDQSNPFQNEYHLSWVSYNVNYVTLHGTPKNE